MILLTHAQEAIFDYAEQATARGRLPADRIQPIAGGALLIDQTGAIHKWRGPQNRPSEHCHLLDLLELDPYGVTTLWNRKIAGIAEGDYLAICPWNAVPQTTAYLRTQCVARALHPQTALALNLSEAVHHLEIPERSPNDCRLPSRSKVRPGPLWRLDSVSAQSLRCYFNLPDPGAPPELATAELGANSYLTYATVSNPEESMRAILTDGLFLPVAQQELNRWLKAAKATKTKMANSAISSDEGPRP